MAKEQTMLRVASVARILDVTKKRVYQLIHEDELEAVRLGPRQTRVMKASLDRYVAALKKRWKESRDEALALPAGRQRPSRRVARQKTPAERRDERLRAFFEER